MITITHRQTGTHHTLSVRGHASKDASDVCIGVSTLVTHLALNLPDGSFASLESGDTLLSWDGCDALFLPVAHTLRAFANEFKQEISYRND